MEKTFEREFQGIQHYEKVSQDHKGLVDVLHVGRDNDAGFYYYVMEIADDENGDFEDIDIDNYRPRTLSSDLRRNPLRKIDECISLGISMASALGHLHQAGLTHRDVKPSNIIFVKGQPRLADIGLVARDGQRTYVGTEGYVPPEGPGTTSADLYSLAMVLYEMHTGKDRLDFPELPTNMELPPTVNRDEWRAMNGVICRAGSPDPRKRFETAHAFAAALRKIVYDRDPKNAERKKRSALSKFALSATMLGLLAVIGGAGLWLQNDLAIFQGKNLLVDQNGESDGTDLTGSGKGNASGESGKLADASTDLNNGGKPETIDYSLIDGPDSDGKMKGNGIVITDTVKASKGKEEEEKSKLIAMPVPVSELKIFSYPTGATVWNGDEEVGRTPTGFLELRPGPVQLTLKLPNYHDYFLFRSLNEGRQSEQIELVRDLRPIPGGGNWINSVSVSFWEDAKGVFISEKPISMEVFERYLRETEQDLPLVRARPVGAAPELAEDDSVQIKDELVVWGFCDWMTDRDRESGYLDRNKYYSPRRPGSNTGNNSFFCALDDRFGTLVLNSEPKGADLYQGERHLGKTPITLNSFRYGPIQIEIRLSGYQSKFAEGTINDSEAVPMTIPLERDASVVYGEKWNNSQGMPLVPVADLMVAVFETRVQDYQHFLMENTGGVYPPKPGFDQGPMHPVAGVSGADAQTFCQWLTGRERAKKLIQAGYEYRLPTDLEWSLFAGLNDEQGETPQDRDSEVKGHFPWGVEWPPLPNSGNFADVAATVQLGEYIIPGYQDGYPETAPVGSFKANQYGIFDLSGNIWEWVKDRYAGPTSSLRAVRGGGWSSFEREELLTSYRNAVPPDMRDGLYGFRYVLAKVKPEK